MKNATVLIAGQPEGQNMREIEVEAGTTAGDVLRALSLNGYLLSLEGSGQKFAAEEVVHDHLVEGSTKLRATPLSVVGEGG